MKGENLSDGQVWQQLVEDSKQLFQLSSKENVAIVPTYQLALHALSKRYLDATCLSNAKQIKEVFSEMLLFRPVWDDEFDGGTHDIKPYSFIKDENGKWTNDKKYIKITKENDKKYLITSVRINESRSSSNPATDISWKPCEPTLLFGKTSQVLGALPTLLQLGCRSV
jgi:hypothetical protein